MTNIRHWVGGYPQRDVRRNLLDPVAVQAEQLGASEAVVHARFADGSSHSVNSLGVFLTALRIELGLLFLVFDGVLRLEHIVRDKHLRSKPDTTCNTSNTYGRGDRMP